MAKETTRKVELQLPEPPAQDLTPIHERLQATEQQVSDLRERAARLETQLQEAIAHNPASAEALRLAAEAREMAEATQKALAKIKKEAEAVPATANKILEVQPPALPPEDPPEIPDDQPQVLTPRRPFWKRFL